MSEQPEQPVMTDAEVDAAQLPAKTDHAHRLGYCAVCGAFNANPTA